MAAVGGTMVGGRTVYPGDIVLGDEDGVIFIRPSEAEELLKQVEAIHENEQRIIDTIEKEGTYIRPWVDEKMKSLGVEYVEYMEF